MLMTSGQIAKVDDKFPIEQKKTNRRIIELNQPPVDWVLFLRFSINDVVHEK